MISNDLNQQHQHKQEQGSETDKNNVCCLDRNTVIAPFVLEEVNIGRMYVLFGKPEHRYVFNI